MKSANVSAASPQQAAFERAAGTGSAATKAPALNASPNDTPELREAFSDFVGQTFFGQLLSAMRKTVGKPAYFHGGRAEEVFQGQLDQILSEKLSDATADQFAGPMYELAMLSRK